MIAGLKPYPAMKDSGVERLGAAQEHCEVRKLPRLLRTATERNRLRLRGSFPARA